VRSSQAEPYPETKPFYHTKNKMSTVKY